MTNEQIKEKIAQLSPEMQQITFAFIKVLQSKDYPTLKRMTIYRWFIDKGNKWKLPFLTRYGYKKELEIIEPIDYLYWETKALRELLH